jgi:hypothetical protein
MRIPFPPMLFPRNALASGPQACFLAEKPTPKMKMWQVAKNSLIHPA